MHKIVDKIDPFNKGVRKSRKSDGSSHYRLRGGSELQPLPQIKGR